VANPLDLFGSWREALQRWEQDTNAALNAAAGDERYSRAMNQSLAVLARIQASHAESVEKALTRANLPSRADFRELHARLDGLETQIAELAGLLRRSSGVGAGQVPMAPSPARTRKPPSAGGSSSQASPAPPPAEPPPNEKSGKGRRKPKDGRGAS
jgi:hypothetical protein